MRAAVKASRLVALLPGRALLQRSTLVLISGSLHQSSVSLQAAPRSLELPPEAPPAAGTHRSPPHPAPQQQQQSRQQQRRAAGGPSSYVSLPVLRPPTILLWLPQHLEPAVAAYFRQSDVLQYTAGTDTVPCVRVFPMLQMLRYIPSSPMHEVCAGTHAKSPRSLEQQREQQLQYANQTNQSTITALRPTRTCRLPTLYVRRVR